MEWSQFLTLFGMISAGVYAFYHITEKRIDRTEERIDRLEEDFKSMDAKWERLFALFIEKLK